MGIILWGVFSVGALVSGLLVISSTNPVHSIFALILAFINISIILIMMGMEYLGFLFMIVYVGAIAILFLFVVMMLNIRLVEIMDNATRYVPAGFTIGIVFLLKLLIITDKDVLYVSEGSSIRDWLNTTVLGDYLFTHGFIYFIIASIVLLVSMIGAIVLTLYHEDSVKRQDIFSQITATGIKCI